MEYKSMIQSALDKIDKKITEDIEADELARAANYSVYHFRRVFIELTGTPFILYYLIRTNVSGVPSAEVSGKHILPSSAANMRVNTPNIHKSKYV